MVVPCWYSDACFDVSFDAIITVCMCSLFGSVMVAEWPPFGKLDLLTWLINACYLCNNIYFGHSLLFISIDIRNCVHCI